MDDPARSAGGALGEYAYQSSRERPIGELVRDIIANVQDMVRSEVRLAKAEIKEETSKTAQGAAYLAVGGTLALYALGFVLVAVAQALNLVMPTWAAALIVAVALGITAAVLMGKGRERLHVPTPEKTIENVKENVEWMKNQTRS